MIEVHTVDDLFPGDRDPTRHMLWSTANNAGLLMIGCYNTFRRECDLSVVGSDSGQALLAERTVVTWGEPTRPERYRVTDIASLR
ncbi:hypothetical protein [Nocardia macrotermitis]|uniref:Uncharacterized protein n=1 Tax=Nocardia macrotermitis TaxID=2585198 RepID=A0A7K0D2W7_9NOCA|nr:hypothetical protein [Nocardia macrotermitis]MQY19602.1 hypothetical protein [Nocardia macrotermitis]